MLRRLVRGSLLAWLGAAAVVPLAAAQTPTVDEIVRQSIAEQMGAKRPASEALPPSRYALSGPVDPARYRLGPGDELVVLWAGRVTRTDRMEVGPAGDIFLAEIGAMNVAGQTLADTRASILAKLQKVTRDVRVDVQLSRPRRFRVYVSGSVASPGPVEALGGSRVSDILRLEDLKPGASTRNILVKHRDGTQELADLERVLRTGDHARDTWLMDGDAIVVPWLAEYIHVSGAVLSPGMVEYRADDSLSTALRLAGGLSPNAAPGTGQWIHWTGASAETLAFDAHAVAAGRFDGALAHSDRVFVRGVPGYRLTGEVRVEGDVARPGGYPVEPGGTRLSAILTAAGGLLSSADSSGILIRLRAQPIPLDEKERERRAKMLEKEMAATDFEVQRAQFSAQHGEVFVDLTRSRKGKEATLDPLLKDGDEITVRRLVNALRIDGQVVNPGVLSYRPEFTLKDYVNQAGGLTAMAWHGHEQVTRAGSMQTQLARSVELRPGDVIWVPTKPQGSWWERSGQLLFVLAQLATIALAIRSLR
jgi:protein involved in polysaccharide export with SLBB domain